jgi:O-antigen ligase
MAKMLKFLDSAIYWLIIIIPFSVAISPGLAHSAIGVMSVFFLLKKALKKERLFIRTPVNLPFIFLLLAALLSFRNTVDYRDSIHGIMKMLQNALVFLICAEEIRDRKHLLRIFYSIVSAAALVSIDAGWQMFSGRDFIRGREIKAAIGLARATASFPNPNVFGVFMSAVTPLILGLSLYYFKGKAKLSMFAVSALVTFGVISTFSRGTGLGFYTAVLLISLVRKQKAVVIFLVSLFLIYPFIMPQKIRDWAKSINYNPLVFMLNYDRVSIYRNALNMAKHHPLIGVGVNTFCRNYLDYKLPEEERAKSAEHVYAHNNFLQMGAEIGLFGLSIFFWFLFRLFKQGFRAVRLLRDDFLKVFSLSVTACILAFLINGMTETSLYYARVAMIFWYFIGLSLSLDKFIHEDNK